MISNTLIPFKLHSLVNVSRKDTFNTAFLNFITNLEKILNSEDNAYKQVLLNELYGLLKTSNIDTLTTHVSKLLELSGTTLNADELKDLTSLTNANKLKRKILHSSINSFIHTSSFFEIDNTVKTKLEKSISENIANLEKTILNNPTILKIQKALKEKKQLEQTLSKSEQTVYKTYISDEKKFNASIKETKSDIDINIKEADDAEKKIQKLKSKSTTSLLLSARKNSFSAIKGIFSIGKTLGFATVKGISLGAKLTKTFAGVVLKGTKFAVGFLGTLITTTVSVAFKAAFGMLSITGKLLGKFVKWCFSKPGLMITTFIAGYIYGRFKEEINDGIESVKKLITDFNLSDITTGFLTSFNLLFSKKLQDASTELYIYTDQLKDFFKSAYTNFQGTIAGFAALTDPYILDSMAYTFAGGAISLGARTFTPMLANKAVTIGMQTAKTVANGAATLSGVAGAVAGTAGTAMFLSATVAAYNEGRDALEKAAKIQISDMHNYLNSKKSEYGKLKINNIGAMLLAGGSRTMLDAFANNASLYQITQIESYSKGNGIIVDTEYKFTVNTTKTQIESIARNLAKTKNNITYICFIYYIIINDTIQPVIYTVSDITGNEPTETDRMIIDNYDKYYYKTVIAKLIELKNQATNRSDTCNTNIVKTIYFLDGLKARTTNYYKSKNNNNKDTSDTFILELHAYYAITRNYISLTKNGFTLNDGLFENPKLFGFVTDNSSKINGDVCFGLIADITVLEDNDIGLQTSFNISVDENSSKEEKGGGALTTFISDESNSTVHLSLQSARIESDATLDPEFKKNATLYISQLEKTIGTTLDTSYNGKLSDINKIFNYLVFSKDYAQERIDASGIAAGFYSETAITYNFNHFFPRVRERILNYINDIKADPANKPLIGELYTIAGAIKNEMKNNYYPNLEKHFAYIKDVVQYNAYGETIQAWDRNGKLHETIKIAVPSKFVYMQYIVHQSYFNDENISKYLYMHKRPTLYIDKIPMAYGQPCTSRAIASTICNGISSIIKLINDRIANTPEAERTMSIIAEFFKSTYDELEAKNLIITESQINDILTKATNILVNRSSFTNGYSKYSGIFNNGLPSVSSIVNSLVNAVSKSSLGPASILGANVILTDVKPDGIGLRERKLSNRTVTTHAYIIVYVNATMFNNLLAIGHHNDRLLSEIGGINVSLPDVTAINSTASDITYMFTSRDTMRYSNDSATNCKNIYDKMVKSIDTALEKTINDLTEKISGKSSIKYKDGENNMEITGVNIQINLGYNANNNNAIKLSANPKTSDIKEIASSGSFDIVKTSFVPSTICLYKRRYSTNVKGYIGKFHEALAKPNIISSSNDFLYIKSESYIEYIYRVISRTRYINIITNIASIVSLCKSYPIKFTNGLIKYETHAAVYHVLKIMLYYLLFGNGSANWFFNNGIHDKDGSLLKTLFDIVELLRISDNALPQTATTDIANFLDVQSSLLRDFHVNQNESANDNFFVNYTTKQFEHKMKRIDEHYLEKTRSSITGDLETDLADDITHWYNSKHGYNIINEYSFAKFLRDIYGYHISPPIPLHLLPNSKYELISEGDDKSIKNSTAYKIHSFLQALLYERQLGLSNSSFTSAILQHMPVSALFDLLNTHKGNDTSVKNIRSLLAKHSLLAFLNNLNAIRKGSTTDAFAKDLDYYNMLKAKKFKNSLPWFAYMPDALFNDANLQKDIIDIFSAFEQQDITKIPEDGISYTDKINSLMLNLSESIKQAINKTCTTNNLTLFMDSKLGVNPKHIGTLHLKDSSINIPVGNVYKQILQAVHAQSEGYTPADALRMYLPDYAFERQSVKQGKANEKSLKSIDYALSLTDTAQEDITRNYSTYRNYSGQERERENALTKSVLEKIKIGSYNFNTIEDDFGLITDITKGNPAQGVFDYFYETEGGIGVDKAVSVINANGNGIVAGFGKNAIGIFFATFSSAAPRNESIE